MASFSHPQARCVVLPVHEDGDHGAMDVTMLSDSAYSVLYDEFGIRVHGHTLSACFMIMRPDLNRFLHILNEFELDRNGVIAQSLIIFFRSHTQVWLDIDESERQGYPVFVHPSVLGQSAYR